MDRRWDWAWTRSFALHSENAEARRRDRRIQAGGDGEAEHVARLSRVYDAVVPQPGRGEIGIALGLVVGADRRLEGFLVLGRPGLAPRFQAFAAYSGQDARRLLTAHDADPTVGPRK